MPNLNIETIDTELREKTGETVDTNNGKCTKYVRRKLKQELRKKASSEFLCMITAEKCVDTSRRLDMDTLLCEHTNDDVNDEEDSLCECGEQESAVVSNSVTRLINSRESTEEMSKNCLRQVRFDASDRQTKAKEKMKDMRRKRERDSKNMRMRFYERNA